MKIFVLVASVFCGLAGVDAGNLKTLREHDLQRMSEYQHDIDENVRKFKENLEGLKTTVDFEAIAV